MNLALQRPAELTPRPDVSLISIEREHAEATLTWLQDPAIAENLGLRRTPSLAYTLAWIDAARAASDVRAFAILQHGAHVGNVVLDRIDRHLGTARLSIYIGPAAARGGGIGRCALVRVLRCAFDDEGLYKVWLTVHGQNHAALAAYHAVGFQHEGTLRGEFLLRGVRHDALYLGARADDLAAALEPPCAA